MSPFRVSLAQAWRELRSGRLTVLILSLAMAVGSLGAVSALSSRMSELLGREAGAMLGADAALRSSNPPPEALIEQARAAGLSHFISAELPTMAGKEGGEPKLAALKAVSSGYPLRGSFLIKDCLDCPSRVAKGGPPAGQAWVDPSFLDSSESRVGDRIALGDTTLAIGALIEQESDRSGAAAGLSPRVMIPLDALEPSGLIQPFSRVTYRLGLAGPEASVGRFVKERPASSGDRWTGASEDREETAQALGRAESFLSLASMLSALLACCALALGARRYAKQTAPELALARAWGMSQAGARARALSSLAMSAAVGTALGCLMALAGQGLLALSLGDLLPKDLPAPGARPFLEASAISLFLLAAFAGAPIYALSRIPPIAALRRDESAWLGRSAPALALSFLCFLGLLVFKSSDATMGMIAACGFAGALIAMSAISLGFLTLCGPLARFFTPGSSARMALLGLRGRRLPNAALASGLAAGLFALALLGLARGDLADAWRDAIPQSAPNRFLAGLDGGAEGSARALLVSLGAASVEAHPIARARLVTINGAPVNEGAYANDERARRAATREWSLSASAELPADNTVEQGRWSLGPNEISLELSLAKALHVGVGDTLGWDSAGVPFETRVTSLRRVDWAKMRANFHALVSPTFIQGKASQALASFKAPSDPALSKALAQAIAKAYPGAFLVDTGQIAKQVRSIADKALMAVQSLFFFSLFCGALTLWAALLSAREERSREAAIARALGASDRLLSRSQALELAALGALAGLIAAGGATLAGYAVSRWALDLPWAFSLWPFWACPLCGAALCVASGRLALRGALKRASLSALRASDP